MSSWNKEEAKQSGLVDSVFSMIGPEESKLPDTAKNEQPDSHRSSAHRWILCIDDDIEFMISLEMRLAEHDVEVVRAFDGTQGYRCVHSYPAQLIILDYEMPDCNGDYVLQRLKESQVTKTIPVIVLTGRKDRALERKMFSMGAAAFVNKPYSWDHLWSVIRPYLQPEHQPA